MQRIRIFYAKTQPLRYTGNLDIHKIWERTLRRAGLPLAYSQGFHPQPKINQACPLPLGMTSRTEIVDIWLDAELTIDYVIEQLSKKKQPGIEIDHLENIDLREPALQTRIAASRYEVMIISLPGELMVSRLELIEKVNAVLAVPSIPRKRREKDYDLRPYIQQLEMLENKPQALLMQLSAQNGATGRPEEVLLAMGIDPFSARIERVGLVFLS